MHYLEHLLILASERARRRDISREELADALLSLASGSHNYYPPLEENDSLVEMNAMWGERFTPSETVADLLRDLHDANHVLCAQAAQLIEQLLEFEGRPANSVPLMVEDR